ncbi:helix-turn-helix domain-containing protein [Candidatus Micrarchaeota archaeon]|nr:helix-turn-helix domain-containing protein [Candidatus Micrarchaeota archaeon]
MDSEERENEYSSYGRGRRRSLGGKAQLEQVLRMYFVERMSMRKVADAMGVSHMSVYRMLSDPNVEVLL